MQSQAALDIQNINCNGDSMSAVVCVNPPTLRVDTVSAVQILHLRPSLAEHACKLNGLGRFVDKIENSTLPHLVEHLTIDILVEWMRKRKLSDAQEICEQTFRLRPISGNTKWLNKERGIMQVNIHAATEIPNTVIQAFTQAVALVNQLATPIDN